MYRPRTEYRHRPYKANSRSGADIFFACAKVYVILFTLFSVTKWLSEQPALQFKNIVISGNHAVTVSDIEHIVRTPMEGRLLWIWKKNNALLYPTRTVRAAIAAADQRIASVAVVSNRREVVVRLNEYQPAFRYCLPRLSRVDAGVLTTPTAAFAEDAEFASTSATGTPAITPAPEHPLASSSLQYTPGEVLNVGLQELPSPEPVAIDTHDCYWADDRGYIYARAPQYSGSPLLTVTESDTSRNETLGGNIPIGNYIFSNDEFAHLMQAVNGLHDAGFNLRRIVRMQSSDIILDVGYPWNLALNIKDDPKNALQHFFLSLKELGDAATGEKSQLKVIDVRFGNKVFYR